MKKTDEPIIVEQLFNVSKERIWKSITDHEEMIKWYFNNIPEFKPVAGFTTQFNITNEGRDFLHKWKICEVIENEKIVYNWQYERYTGSADVYFQLFDAGDFVRLEVKVIVLEDFPEDIPEFTRDSCRNGWKYFINESLYKYITGTER
jgi:uncharacterized protein YndB with AHSA1/START domain